MWKLFRNLHVTCPNHINSLLSCLWNIVTLRIVTCSSNTVMFSFSDWLICWQASYTAKSNSISEIMFWILWGKCVMTRQLDMYNLTKRRCWTCGYEFFPSIVWHLFCSVGVIVTDIASLIFFHHKIFPSKLLIRLQSTPLNWILKMSEQNIQLRGIFN